MKSFLKEKAVTVVAWVHRQPAKINVLCVVLSLAWLLSPLGLAMNLLLGPGQLGDGIVIWFIWHNVRALVARQPVITVQAIAPENTHAP
jgi:uncharacterized membrane protein YkvA (DUF1232 family)